MRKIISLTAASVAAALLLAGCANGSATSMDAPVTCQPYASGPEVSQVKVTEKGNAAPSIDYSGKLQVSGLQGRVLTPGSGPLFGGGQQAKIEYEILDAATKKVLSGSAWDGSNPVTQVFAANANKSGIDLCRALSGARPGSIVAFLADSKTSHGNKADAANGIGAKDSLLFIFKVAKVWLPKAIGDAQPGRDGFPQVVSNAKGVPGITMANWDASAAPSTFQNEVLIKGHGAVLKENDTVTVHYSGFIWSASKTKFDSSWDNGSPATFQLKKGALIPGFIKALVGQTVGSRVVAILPPADGYGATGSGSIPGNSTLIFVVDILGEGK
ncbi:MAG: FKBP-type peptidyl-prolyl cis-trans isomerase [Micrococcales bacterium]